MPRAIKNRKKNAPERKIVQMQEQMTKQAETLFPGMPGWVPPKH